MSEANGPVLVVEDDKGIREVLQMALELDGYEVVSAKNGQEALDYLDKGRLPQLILLDLMMPVMNGWEFLERVDESPAYKKLPVIIVSAYCEKARDLKCVAFYEKPMDLDSLLSQIKQYTGKNHGTTDRV
jgi:two-component system, chemotaxis family, chemotaxis protein CheY